MMKYNNIVIVFATIILTTFVLVQCVFAQSDHPMSLKDQTITRAGATDDKLSGDITSISGPMSFVFGEEEPYFQIYQNADGTIGVQYPEGKLEESAKAFFNYLQSAFSFNCPSDKEVLEVLKIALRYIDSESRLVTSSTLEYCDDLCQAERAVERIKQRREDVKQLNMLIHKLGG